MRNKFYRPGTIILGLAIAVVLFLTSCTDQDEPTPIETAYVSIYHGSPDVSGLDILVSTGQINDQPFEYEDFTHYLNFYAGERFMKFSVANTGIMPLIDTTFTFEVDRSYSVFVANTVNSPQAILFEDSFPESISGKAMVRFIHLSPDSPAVKVLADEDDLFSENNFKDGSEFLSINAGRNTFEFIDVETQNTLLQVPNVEIQEGRYYNIILKGFSAPPLENTHELSADIIRL